MYGPQSCLVPFSMGAHTRHIKSSSELRVAAAAPLQICARHTRSPVRLSRPTSIDRSVLASRAWVWGGVDWRQCWKSPHELHNPRRSLAIFKDCGVWQMRCDTTTCTTSVHALGCRINVHKRASTKQTIHRHGTYTNRRDTTCECRGHDVRYCCSNRETIVRRVSAVNKSRGILHHKSAIGTVRSTLQTQQHELQQ